MVFSHNPEPPTYRFYQVSLQCSPLSLVIVQWGSHWSIDLECWNIFIVLLYQQSYAIKNLLGDPKDRWLPFREWINLVLYNRYVDSFGAYYIVLLTAIYQLQTRKISASRCLIDRLPIQWRISDAAFLPCKHLLAFNCAVMDDWMMYRFYLLTQTRPECYQPVW